MAQEQYILGQSIDKQLDVGQEIKLDVTLIPKQSLNQGNLNGTVKDGTGTPLQNATVKVLDETGNPVVHTTTDLQGKYSFVGLPASPHYHVIGTKEGYTVSPTKVTPIVANQTMVVDLVCDLITSVAITLVGDVFSDSTKAPISGAIVEIKDAQGTTINTVITNSTGQYLIPDLAPALYTIIVNAQGFNAFSQQITLPSGTHVMNYDITLIPKPETTQGTVNGVITDNNNIPLPNAYVVLYKVTQNGLVPIQVAKSNATGEYLFSNVPAGEYKVKANLFN